LVSKVDVHKGARQTTQPRSWERFLTQKGTEKVASAFLFPKKMTIATGNGGMPAERIQQESRKDSKFLFLWQPCYPVNFKN